MIAEQIGPNAPAATEDWHVGHGDLHWAHLTAPRCMLLDSSSACFGWSAKAGTDDGERSVKTKKMKFLKWGNGLALRVPSAFAREIGASEGKRAEMTVEDGALVVKLVEPRPRRRYRLEELIVGITEESYRREVEWGGPVGNEAW